MMGPQKFPSNSFSGILHGMLIHVLVCTDGLRLLCKARFLGQQLGTRQFSQHAAGLLFTWTGFHLPVSCNSKFNHLLDPFQPVTATEFKQQRVLELSNPLLPVTLNG